LAVLNLAKGGSVAVELDRIYNDASRRLLDVTLHHDVSGLAEIDNP
jgi:flagellin-specific chaperone FliS